MKDICVVGAGNVGLVTAACLAELGNKVICVDNNIKKIEGLEKGILPFYEPGLDEMVCRNRDSGKLSLGATIEEGARKADIIFICVGTPQKSDGDADLSFVEAVSRDIAREMDGYKVVVEKSTVPVKTGTWVKRTIKLNNTHKVDFDVVSNPEFLGEGSAIYDFMHPDRIVIGVESEKAADMMTELYKPLNAPIIITNIETAELIKHASNSFLALKISYINAIANICEKVDADVVQVAEGMGYDRRIGRQFLNAGVGYGGSCFPKDIAAFIKIAQEVGYDFGLLKEVQKINESQRQQIVYKARSALWNLRDKTIGILGLSFKPNTDDMREAPSIGIISLLRKEGAKIKAYDPQAMKNAEAVLHDVEFCQNPYDVAKDSEALIFITEWDEFKNLDLPRVKQLLKQPIIIDGRNIFDPAGMERLGFSYQGMGR